MTTIEMSCLELTHIDKLLKFFFNPVSYSGEFDLSVAQPWLGHECQLRRTLEPIPVARHIKHVPFIPRDPR